MDELLKFWMASVELMPKEKKYILDNFNTSDELYNLLKNEKEYNEPHKKFQRMLMVYEDIVNNDKLNYMKKIGAKIAIKTDDVYPKVLKEYTASPYTLFYKGDIQRINESVNLAVVGSRNCTIYGENVTNLIIDALKVYNISLNVVSGLARGIDSVAHSAALRNNFTTTAVLGAGLDVIYPKENTGLYENIINSGGCIISEFPLGTKPLQRNFPIRNNVISGLSDVLLVTEGGERSGTLITVGAALEQGKSVITVPGSIFSKNSVATNRLARDGANVFTEIDDLVDLLNNSSFYKNNNIEICPKISEDERILNLIDENPIHIDDIAAATDIDIKQLYKLLFELQVKKEILCLSGNFYVRVNKKLQAK